jgi:hypothetical protein
MDSHNKSENNINEKDQDLNPKCSIMESESIFFDQQDDCNKSMHPDLEINPNNNQRKNSAISCQSIEAFLDSLPTPPKLEKQKGQIFQTVQDMMVQDIGIKKNMSLRKKIKLVLESNQCHFFLIVLG